VQRIARELALDLDNLAAHLRTSQSPKPLPKDFAVVNDWDQSESIAGDPAQDQDIKPWIPFYLNALIDQVKLAHDAVRRLEMGAEGR
jgi:hypothetical protein